MTEIVTKVSSGTLFEGAALLMAIPRVAAFGLTLGYRSDTIFDGIEKRPQKYPRIGCLKTIRRCYRTYALS